MTNQVLRQEVRALSLGQALDYGVELALAGNPLGASNVFRGVLKLDPDNFEATTRLGSALFEQKLYHEALYWFWRARKMDRKHPLALTNYGLTVSQLGHPEEGVGDLERARTIAEKSPNVSPEAMSLIYNNLGNTYERLKRYPEALVALSKGIEINRNDAFPRYNRGIVLLRLNRQGEAISDLNVSLELDPRNPDARYNRGLAHLLLGCFKEGWEDYEFRLLTSENTAPNLGLPLDKKWLGEDLRGKRILVHAEQGLGDELQFLRFLPLLRARDPVEVLFVSHNEVRAFAEKIEGVTLLAQGEALADRYDAWVALMSLPLFLGINSDEKIEATPPLLPPPDQERIEKWRDELKLPPAALNVGVCWSGQWQHKNQAHRSIPIDTFAKVFSATGCNFVSLQQIVPGEVDAFAEIKAKHTNLQALWFDDFRDTAAAIMSLDLVLSVDTAVAHLAASLGVPTWVLIPKFGTDWRWRLDRADSPWYPSVRLIRQKTIGGWAATLNHVKAEIEREALERREASRAA